MPAWPATPALELRVSRLEDDSTALYELVSDISTTVHEHSHRLDSIDTHLEGIDRRLDGMDSRLDGMDSRVEGHDSRFDRIDATQAEVLRRLPDPA